MGGGCVNGGGEQRVEVGCSARGGHCWEGWPRGGDVEARDQALGVGVCGRRRWWGRFLGRKTQEVLLDELDGLFEVGIAGSFCAVVRGGDEVIDGSLVILKPRVDVRLIEDLCALCLGEDQVEEKGETHPGVSGDPGMLVSLLSRREREWDCIPEEDGASPRLNKEGDGQHDPVHEPWRQQRGVRGVESLVGGEHGEKEGRDGAIEESLVSVRAIEGSEAGEWKPVMMVMMMMAGWRTSLR